MHIWFRRSILALFLLCAGTTVTLATAPAAHADCAASITDCGQLPPKNFQAQAPNNGSVVLYWDNAPTANDPQNNWNIAKDVEIFRDNEMIVTLPVDASSPQNSIPNTYTDPNPPQGKELAYKARITSRDGNAGEFSTEAKITPVPKAQADPNIAPAPSTDGGTSAGTVAGPNISDGGAPTAFEAYGGPSNADFASSFTDDASLIQEIETWPVRVLWHIMVYLNYVTLVFLAWTISPDFYKGISAGVAAVVQGIFSLGIFDNLTELATIVGAIGIILLALRHQLRNAWRGVLFVMIGILVTTLYTLAPVKAINVVLTYPTQATSYLLGYTGVMADFLTGGNDSHGRLGFKIEPGYTGKDPAYDGVRRFQEAEWLSTIAAGTCTLNFNDLAWATSNPVPIRGDAPDSFKNGMNYCEYFIKANHDHNDTEKEYLAKQVDKYAPQQVKDTFTGTDVGSQYGIIFLLSMAIGFRTSLLAFCAYVFAMCVLVLAIYMIKFAVVQLAFRIPWLEPFATRLVKLAAIKFFLPPIMATSLIIGLLLGSLAVWSASIGGWEMSMLLQVVAGAGSLAAGWAIYRAQRRKATEIKASRETQWDRFDRSAPENPESDSDSASASAPAITAASAPAIGAGSVAALPPPPGAASSTNPSLKRTVAVAALTGGTSAVVDLGTQYAGQKVGAAAHAGVEYGRDKWHAIDNKMSQSTLWPSRNPVSNDPRTDAERVYDEQAAATTTADEERQSWNPRPPSTGETYY